MRRCNVCGETKSLSEFGSNKTQPLGKSYMCKPCRRSYDKRKYREKPEIYKERHFKHKGRQTIKNREIIWKAIQTPCHDCGIKNPIVMEFDHRPDEEKLYNIGAMVGNTYSLETLKTEIAKCDVVCANCHRIRTNGRGSWWRGIMSEESNNT